MDLLNQYLFDNLKKHYAHPNVTPGEMEELYICFGNLDHLEQVHPYLLAMRYFGWGTAPQPKEVLEELNMLRQVAGDDANLMGLYEDLIISSGKGTAENRKKLEQYKEKGYTSAYLKDKSALSGGTSSGVKKSLADTAAKKNTAANAPKKPTPPPAKKPAPAAKPQPVPALSIKKVEFQSRGVVAGEFNTLDVDYLCAKVYVEPASMPRKITAKSQIFTSSGKAQSTEFTTELTLNPGSTWFLTTGWGSKEVGSYPADRYKWVVRINDGKSFESWFRITGANEFGELKINRVGLFASKLKEARSEDLDRFQTSFASRFLECVYVRAMIQEPGKNLRVKVYIKMENLDTNTMIYEETYTQDVRSNSDSIYKGVGYDAPGHWKPGRYRYTFNVGSSRNQGTFTVY